MPSSLKPKRVKSSKIGKLETKLPKIKSAKVPLAPKVRYVLRKDHAKPTKLA